MAQRVGKYKVSRKEAFLDLRDTENNTPASLVVDTDAMVVTNGGGVHVGGTDNPGDNNLKVDGTIQSVAGNVTATDGNFVITAADHGIIHTGTGTVTQTGGAHTNGVTLNTTSGVITLEDVALANATNAEFTFTNSNIKTTSVILLSTQDENTTDNTCIIATFHTVANGSCVININHPDSVGSTSTTASKVHFLIINPS